MKRPFRCIVLGAAGRDFHDFQTFFRTHPDFHVVAFTATQIPFIEQRRFPKELCGPGYDDDIPIYAEERLTELIRALDVDFVFLAYSDLAYADVLHKASIAQAAGASFVLLGPRHTALRARRPVVSVTAVRTGAGKSPLTQAIAKDLRAAGFRVGILRHPMPYGDLRAQAVQRFATTDDLDRHACTLEEREEYLPYVEQGLVIFAGVDYAQILRAAEEESDVILWDGGNNDTPFVKPDLAIVVADPLRPGHEVAYYPGETNVRSADVVVLSKCGRAAEADIRAVEERITALRPSATLLRGDLVLELEHAERVRGARVLAIEDGPTVTHGGMAYGAATLAAREAGAAALVDPRPFAVGTIAAAYRAYPHLGPVLPALGYSVEQRRELAATIASCDADLVVDGSPAAVATTLGVTKPVVRVRYRFVGLAGPDVFALVRERLATLGLRPPGAA